MGIDGSELKAGSQNLRSAVYIGNQNFHLLDSFSEFFQKARDCAGSSVVAGRNVFVFANGEDVEAGVAGVDFKLAGILVGGHVGERRSAEGFVNAREGAGEDGDADGGRLVAQEQRKLRVFLPVLDNTHRKFYAGTVKGLGG